MDRLVDGQKRQEQEICRKQDEEVEQQLQQQIHEDREWRSQDLRQVGELNLKRLLVSILGRLYTYLHPPSRADEVSGYSWPVITAICDEDDFLTLCDQLS
jgi:hypothetical protein